MMVGIGRRVDRRVQALLTDMSQPLGYAVGNAVEVMEVSQVLHNEGPDDLKRLFSSESSRAEDDEDEEAADAARAHGGARIEDLLKEGQEIVVQVTKEPISTKGARTTRYIQEEIFGFAEIVSMASFARMASEAGLRLLHAEDVSDHYQRTVAAW